MEQKMVKLKKKSEDWYEGLIICSTLSSFIVYAMGAKALSMLLALFMCFAIAKYHSPTGQIVLYGKDLSKPE
jgi:hypothetical protein